MKLSTKAEMLCAQITPGTTRLGDLRKIASDTGKDHQLAMELWAAKSYLLRQLAILIMYLKLITQEVADRLDQDMQQHPTKERLQLIDWLLANQLSKD
ncbi:hypothetical protein [Flaviaesturariibacter flavus]|uniref:hypothetical protein n=1 Tax=Flaviaesturariibacter flavus TaxID=2502780 RepID=UPI001A9EA569|nr:hypothetical protein [Flaviaesturariibacter flavus]